MAQINIIKSALLLLIGLISLIKGIIYFKSQEYTHLIFLIGIFGFINWILIAAFHNWDLPAPYGYENGKNQIGRIIFCALMVGMFFLMIFHDK
jgi:hypothetical protein